MKRATASKDASGQRWWCRLSNIAEFADIPEYSVTGNLTLQDVSNLVTEIYTRNYKAVNGTAPPLNKADPIMLTLKSMTELYYMMIQIAEKRTRCALLKTATGAELDNMGLPFGVKRNGATYATVTVRFSLSAVLKTVAMIPQETRVRTAAGVYFATMDYAQIDIGKTYVDVLAQAEVVGAGSNDIPPGVVDTLVDAIPYVAAVENTDTSSGGADVESDDSLTRRIWLSPTTYSCAGPKDAYEFWAMKCETKRQRKEENNVRRFKHLTWTDRLRIEKWLNEGMKPKDIASKLRVHISTVYNELHRGEYQRLVGDTWELVSAYSPDIAEQKYQAHLRDKGPALKIGKDHELANYIETTILNKECSPAAVFGYAQQEGKQFKTSVSVQTVYHYIKKGLFLNLTQEELPRHGKHKQAYKKVCKKEAARAPAGESIEQRPPEVNERQEFGHWEGDTVYSGKGKVKTTCALFTITERKTRNEIIIGVPNRKAETIVKAVDALERKLGARKFRLIFKSITFDNGTEFAAADMLERSCINKTIPRTKVYFCHPYSSWERGSNEHVNGMIRRKHPKGTDFSKVSKEQLAATEKWINEYPRKIFGYKSSAIMFQQCLNELGIAM